MKTYVTFGQAHTHSINGKTLNKDTVAVIESESAEAGREMAFDLFCDKFCFEYPEEHWDDSKMHYFPKGYVKVN
tara:strand:- start:22632 stop:22853 length:222 start_codon:yes stop_codon:yes gene_type:complete